MDRGELPNDIDASALAATILAAIEGVESQWLIDPSVDPTAATRTLVRFLDGPR